MHTLLMLQAFIALNEPGGTRHKKITRCLASQGHRVTVIVYTFVNLLILT